MKPKDLYARISDLESLLNHFSFEELTTEEAAYLKSTFNAFKSSLDNERLNSVNGKKDIPNQIRRDILPALEYLRDCSRLLGRGRLTQEQSAYINGMQQITRMLLKKVQGPITTVGPMADSGSGKAVDFNLHHLLRNVLFINKTLTEIPTLKISIDMDSEVSEIQRGAPSLLSQMLMHIFGKGIRYLDTGSISLRISQIRETRDTSYLEFEFLMRDAEFQNHNSKLLFQKPELRFRSFQKWMEKYHLQSEVTEVSNSALRINFVLPFQKPERATAISRNTFKKSDNFPLEWNAQVRKIQKGYWDSLWKECGGDIKILEERLNRWQGQLLGFVGRARMQLKNMDFEGLKKSTGEIIYKLDGIPFQDIRSLLERMEQTCATDKDPGHLQFLYKSLLEEYGIMDRTIADELKRLEREGRS
ncbi:hypothetical protein K8352_08090 [Flavobacteriaceae bacterium F89]|uniref:Uncharacterized protein n=1 Tax=Cerina litoralis TaxID=2874477 RepID=A0AAE3EV46_9FLAO|nr:hypothetical protein [Cerina litoralis]MCG2460704.1 hypothetical protein [Cerina litoralis]